MATDGRIDYVEFAATDIATTKAFYQRLFGWTFEDYGPDYTSFSDGRIAGGFAKTDRGATGGPLPVLIVLYGADLEAFEANVRAAGGGIVKPIFSFPGGRRFHFTDPSGYELAIWSDK
jgi:predicted enzyme related to lactoylglutathione lyase